MRLSIGHASAAVLGAIVAAFPATRKASPEFEGVSVAVDTAGAVYVSIAGDSAIAVFAPGADGSVAPVRRIAGPGTGLISPGGIALDSRGRIHVASGNRAVDKGGSITVYPPGSAGNVAPVRVIQGPRAEVRDPSAIAVAPRGEVYVVTQAGALVIGFGVGANGDVEPEQRFPSKAREWAFSSDDGMPGASDIEIGEDGSLLVVGSEGVTSYTATGPRVRRLLRSTGRMKNAPSFPERPRLARGPGGDLYVVQRSPLGPGASRIDSAFTMLRPLSVFVYPPGESGDTVPARIIGGSRAELRSITDLAVGRDGSLYILGGGTSERISRGESRVSIYPPKAAGDVLPARTIGGSRTGLAGTSGLALDRGGRIYVTNSEVIDRAFEAARLTVHAPGADGNAAPIRVIAGPATRMSEPAGVAVAEDGTVYVVNRRVFSDDRGSVRVYAGDAAGDAPTLRTLIGPTTRFAGPAAIAVDRGDTLYVVSPSLGRVTVHPPGAEGGAAPVRILEGDAGRLGGATGIALDHLGLLYVASRDQASGINAYGPDLGSIRVYSAGARDNEAPLRTIRGSFTRLNGPGGLVVDRRGNLYVANLWGSGPGSVTVYGPGAQGDVRPRRMIAGPATGLRRPAALALDGHDTLYVLGAGGVTVYPPGADGNVAPIRAFSGP